MTQAAPPPIPPSAGQTWISPPEPGSRAARRAGLWSFSSPGRDGGALFAVPATPLSTSSQESLLAGLRARIESLERHASSPALRALGSDAARAPLSSSPWTLGAPEIDAHLMGGLDASSLHEVKPQACAADPAAGASAGQWAAALGFALRLAVRRSDALDARSGVRAPVLWCWTSAVARELGQPCGQGLAALGLDPRACLFVETKRASEALWAMEEGLKSASLALVVGVMKAVELTPARRLGLAAAGSLTPCLVVTDPRAPAAGSTATRWRIGALKSAPHPFDRDAPGARRFTASLERCRHAALTPQALSLSLEWSDETHRFRVASALAHRADAPRRARSGA